MSNSNQVSKLYNTVVEDVINNVKEAFLDEGVDEQVLQDLKQLWESKLAASKALEPPPQPEISFPPPQATNVMLPQAIQAANSQPRPETSDVLDPCPVTVVGFDNDVVAMQSDMAISADDFVVTQPQPKIQPVPAQFQPAAAAAATQPATLTLPSGLFQQQIAALGAGGQMQNITLQQTGNGQYITVAGLSQLPQFQQLQQTQQLGQQVQVPQQLNIQQRQPIHIQPQPQQQQPPKLLPHGATIIQQNPAGQVLAKGQTIEGVVQLDGCADTSSSDDDDFDDDDKEDDAKDELEEEEQAEEEEPLNSDDDISEEDPTELFDSDNVVVCQYDKIHRNRNKWKFHLKDGIMNLNGRDFVFQKATGDSEW